jgi:hypothetical protein
LIIHNQEEGRLRSSKGECFKGEVRAVVESVPLGISLRPPVLRRFDFYLTLQCPDDFLVVALLLLHVLQPHPAQLQPLSQLRHCPFASFQFYFVIGNLLLLPTLVLLRRPLCDLELIHPLGKSGDLRLQLALGSLHLQLPLCCRYSLDLFLPLCAGN